MSESSGAPIELLYRLIEERDGQLPKPPPKVNTSKKHKGLHAVKRDGQVQGPALKIKISNLVRKKYSIFSATARKSSAGASSRLSLPSVFPASPAVKKAVVSASSSSSFSLSPLRVEDSGTSAERSPPATTAPAASAKPLWAPQETDAPLNLSMSHSLACSTVLLFWVRLKYALNIKKQSECSMHTKTSQEASIKNV